MMTEDERPHIDLEPCCLFGRPHINGHRLDPEQMAGMWWDDCTLDEIFGGFEIGLGQLLVSCWFVVNYGSRKWQKRWGQWAKDNWDLLWHSRFDEIEMPPQQTPKPIVGTISRDLWLEEGD
jgi:uncharacterized protein (DUF433 family)